jgi:hypothetical protein
VLNPNCGIARVSDSRKSINREKESLFDILSTDIHTSLEPSHPVIKNISQFIGQNLIQNF